MPDEVITLGPCHYNFDETAVAVAVHKDGAGWIPVCEEHKKEAENHGYEIRPDARVPADSDVGKAEAADDNDG